MLKLEDLAALANAHPSAVSATVREFSIGPTHFPFNSKPSLMGVINLSPDSWYRESVCLSIDQAIQRAHVLHHEGAQIIDIGAESTLAHARRLGDIEQNSRLLPIVRELSRDGILVSVETYYPEVARASLQAGATVLNLTGTSEAGAIYPVVAEHDAALILCFVRGGNVREASDFDLERDPVDQMREYFEREIERAEKAGVRKILIDPGLGFYYRNLQDSATRIRHQMRTFLNTFRLRSLGFPVCQALPHAFEHFGAEVRSAESFFAVLALLGKTDLLRTHEIPKVRAVLDTLGSW
jgi:dihydropteroate synthase